MPDIEVDQNELVVVANPEDSDVRYLFTRGMNPCAGLLLWCPRMCVVAHFHDSEQVPQCAPVVARFIAVSEAEERRAYLSYTSDDPRQDFCDQTMRVVAEMGKLLGGVEYLDRYVPAKKPTNPKDGTGTTNARLRCRNGACTAEMVSSVEYVLAKPTRVAGPHGSAEWQPRWLTSPFARKPILIGVYNGTDVVCELGNDEGSVRALMETV